MRIEKRVLNRVEGEIELKLVWKRGRIKDAYISAPNYRGFEEILKGRPHWDALVITPRVCGICGHAHLMASVRAIEDAYKTAGVDISLSKKAQDIRTLTLFCEILQNHLRWFYLYLLPDVVKLEPSLEELYEPLRGKRWSEALDASNRPIKVIALFGGQWPHTSYAVPGGVVCEPTEVEVSQSLMLLEKLRLFLESFLLEMTLEDYLSLGGEAYISSLRGDLGRFVEVCIEEGLDSEGRSYRRFVSGGEIEPLSVSGTFSSRLNSFDLRKVRESEEFTFFRKKGYTWSKAVRYNGLPYETGPLARQVVGGNKVIRALLKEFGDSAMVRVLARMDEAVRLLLYTTELLKGVNTEEESWRRPDLDMDRFSGRGVGIVEAARGTLIHEVDIKNGRIEKYNIITPTVWNLGPRDSKNLGVAERALVGLDSELKAEIVLRSFDVCSVCTAH